MLFKLFKFISSIFFISDKTNPTKNEYTIWTAMKVIIILGFLMILSICIENFYQTDYQNNNLNYYIVFFKVFGLLILIGGASFMSGGLIGFLFGIPKVIQNTNLNESNLADNQTKIAHNDNLVQVSDWLTKIIVGVGLTQLYKIPKVLFDLGNTIEHNSGYPLNSISVNTTVATIVYFSVTGFGCSYLWTRLYFTKMLASTNKDLNELLENAQIELEKKEKDLEKKDKDLKAVTNTFYPEFEKMKLEQKLINRANPLENEDFQKGKWGGQLKSNDRLVSAKVEPTSFNKELFNVTLKVESTNPQNPLVGDVLFHLHPTFIKDEKIVTAKDGVAELYLLAYGAFTVGIECDNGRTKLEIDLATDVPEAPNLFKER